MLSGRKRRGRKKRSSNDKSSGFDGLVTRPLPRVQSFLPRPPAMLESNESPSTPPSGAGIGMISFGSSSSSSSISKNNQGSETLSLAGGSNSKTGSDPPPSSSNASLGTHRFGIDNNDNNAAPFQASNKSNSQEKVFYFGASRANNDNGANLHNANGSIGEINNAGNQLTVSNAQVNVANNGSATATASTELAIFHFGSSGSSSNTMPLPPLSNKERSPFGSNTPDSTASFCFGSNNNNNNAVASNAQSSGIFTVNRGAGPSHRTWAEVVCGNSLGSTNHKLLADNEQVAETATADKKVSATDATSDSVAFSIGTGSPTKLAPRRFRLQSPRSVVSSKRSASKSSPKQRATTLPKELFSERLVRVTLEDTSIDRKRIVNAKILLDGSLVVQLDHDNGQWKVVGCQNLVPIVLFSDRPQLGETVVLLESSDNVGSEGHFSRVRSVTKEAWGSKSKVYFMDKSGHVHSEEARSVAKIERANKSPINTGTTTKVFVSRGCFQNCSNLRTFSFHETRTCVVASLGSESFDGCVSLKTFDCPYPASKRIVPGTFRGCTSLQDIFALSETGAHRLIFCPFEDVLSMCGSSLRLSSALLDLWANSLLTENQKLNTLTEVILESCPLQDERHADFLRTIVESSSNLKRVAIHKCNMENTAALVNALQNLVHRPNLPRFVLDFDHEKRSLAVESALLLLVPVLSRAEDAMISVQPQVSFGNLKGFSFDRTEKAWCGALSKSNHDVAIVLSKASAFLLNCKNAVVENVFQNLVETRQLRSLTFSQCHLDPTKLLLSLENVCKEESATETLEISNCTFTKSSEAETTTKILRMALPLRRLSSLSVGDCEMFPVDFKNKDNEPNQAYKIRVGTRPLLQSWASAFESDNGARKIREVTFHHTTLQKGSPVIEFLKNVVHATGVEIQRCTFDRDVESAIVNFLKDHRKKTALEKVMMQQRDPSTFVSVLEATTQPRSLKHLELRDCSSFGSDGVRAIVSALKKNGSTIEHLRLISCGLGTRHTHDILGALKSNTTLTELSLQGNKHLHFEFDSTFCQELADAQYLQELLLPYNDTLFRGRARTRRYATRLRHNLSLTCISIEGKSHGDFPSEINNLLNRNQDYARAVAGVLAQVSSSLIPHLLSKTSSDHIMLYYFFRHAIAWQASGSPPFVVHEKQP